MLMRIFRVLVALIAFICLLPVIALFIMSFYASSHGCTVHEGFPTPCIVDGKDVGPTLYAVGVSGWVMIATIPILAWTLVVWLAVEVIRLLRWRR